MNKYNMLHLYRILICLILSTQLSAAPLTTQFIDIPNMRQSECLQQATTVLQNLNFLEIKTVDNSTVFAQDPPYYAAILCHAEKETVYISIAGKRADKSTQFMQTIHKYFKHAVIETNLCALSESGWQACDGKLVKLAGIVPAPHQILPAPMLNMPAFTSTQVDMPNLIQSYLNVGKRQIILLSSQPISCVAGLEVVGRLESVALGGAPRTQNSYEGWAIYVDSALCLQ